jgi:hypothetical protein
MDIKIKFNGDEMEGHPDHIAILIRSLGQNPGNQLGGVGATSDLDDSGMSAEFAERALSRRPLSPAQRKLFKMLLQKGHAWLPSSDIMKNMGFNGNQYGGLFGAIGRRMAKTKGFKEGFTLFEWLYNEDSEEYLCRLHPSALEALNRISL